MQEVVDFLGSSFEIIQVGSKKIQGLQELPTIVVKPL